MVPSVPVQCLGEPLSYPLNERVNGRRAGWMDKVQAVTVTVIRGEACTLRLPWVLFVRGAGQNEDQGGLAGRLIRIYLIGSKTAL